MSSSTPDQLELLGTHLPLRGEVHRDAIGLDEATAFATSIGSALHADPAGRLVAPATILTRLIITDRPPWYEELRRGTMFHAGERYVTHREILVGRELEWDGTLEMITSKNGRSGRLWFVRSHYAFRDAADLAPVADVWRTRVVVTT